MASDERENRLRRGSLQDTLLHAESDGERRRSLHGSVHPLVSFIFVASCLANGGMFAWSNVSVGAEVWTEVCLLPACPDPTRSKVFQFDLRTCVSGASALGGAAQRLGCWTCWESTVWSMVS
jgi:hypothetical protein